MELPTSKLIQVTNVSPTVSKEQMRSLFGIIGEVEEVKLYPENPAVDVATRVGFVKFKESESVGVSIHLTNSVLVDKALIIVPVLETDIPDEMKALGLISEGDNVYNGLPQYPVLPANTELSKVEEIRRTIYCCDIDSTLTPEALMPFFSQAGEIKYMRMAGDEKASFRGAFVEYSEQNSVLKALNMNGQSLGGSIIKMTPSKTAILKPPVLPGITASSKEIEEALKKVNEVESLISAVVNPPSNGDRSSRSHRRSKRSRSRSRRSRSRRSRRSRSRRSRSGRSRRHSRSKSRDKKKRSRDGRRRRRSRSSSGRRKSGSRGESKHRSSEKSKHESKSSKEKKRKRSRSSSHKRKHKNRQSSQE